ncbi:hypothetical protein LSH36_119g12008 [Paralvinella palmiformis]|uniref:G-protein coupled receptors family 1 profile domain-containing protein n=1 Tax=Paralvinella palmiformis TaxID=53620 RepID=A0AAD9JZY1_9ANNE|nr:hypothetical protein LSH36_119g12008 [Paralvinella palmiformis]
MSEADTVTLANGNYTMAGNITTDMMNGTNNDSSWSNETILYIAEDSRLKQFGIWYQGIHGYVSIVVCVFGIVSNIMNIMVLTQRNMVTPTNYLLTALAIADMLTMTSYLPFAVYFYCVTELDYEYNHPQGWIVYLIFNTNFIITCHTIAMWLTVSLAVFRYIVVCHHTLGPKLCNLYRAKITIIAVFVTTVLFCIPNYVMYKPVLNKGTTGGYWFTWNTFIKEFHKIFNFWLFGVVIKVAPCVLLTVLSSLLIHAMRLAEKKRQRLKSQGKRAESERTSEHNRTTAMLVAVVLCFVIAELPQGILAFLSGVDNDIFYNVYIPLGDVWDILVLVNSAVNFVLYCIMSRQFRSTFKEVFLVYCLKPKHKTPNGVQYSTIETQATKYSTTDTKL